MNATGLMRRTARLSMVVLAASLALQSTSAPVSAQARGNAQAPPATPGCAS